MTGHTSPLANFALAALCLLPLMACGSSSNETFAPPARDEPAAESVRPVAVELFTSQGCSSCPPADRLIAEIADHPDLVVITRPVTYWDRLGWKDTLAREENTRLQRAYAPRLRGDGGRSYTPQAVIDGSYGLVGSRRTELTSQIEVAHAHPSDVRLAVRPSPNGGRIIALSGIGLAPARLELVALDSHESVSIGRGENGGRSVSYTNVVRDERLIGEWNGGSQQFAIRRAALDRSDADRFAIIVRQGVAGPILAARYL